MENKHSQPRVGQPEPVALSYWKLSKERLSIRFGASQGPSRLRCDQVPDALQRDAEMEKASPGAPPGFGAVTMGDTHGSPSGHMMKPSSTTPNIRCVARSLAMKADTWVASAGGKERW